MSSVALHRHEFVCGLCFVSSHVETWVDGHWCFCLTKHVLFANRIMQTRCSCSLFAMGGWILHICCTRIFIVTNVFGTVWMILGTNMPNVLLTLGRLFCNKKRLTSLSVSARLWLKQNHIDKQIKIDAASNMRATMWENYYFASDELPSDMMWDPTALDTAPSLREALAEMTCSLTPMTSSK